MIRVDAGRPARYCDGLSRRSFLQVGVAGMASAGLGRILQARAAGAGRKDTAVILLWLSGGPGHMDMYDMKPEAPIEYAGIWKPTRTNVPGMHLSPLFPRQARIADKFSIVRSLHHTTSDHYGGAHVMLTGRLGRVSGAKQDGEYPGIGAIAAKVRGANRPGMPPYVGCPNMDPVVAYPYHRGNYLGNAYDPFDVGQDPNAPGFQVENLRPAGGLTADRLEDREGLLAHFDTLRRDVDSGGALETMDHFQRSAYGLVTGAAARRAFDLSTEDPRLRDRYGRTTWGQSALLARRLVESGVTWVTVNCAGWDHHWDLEAGMNSFLPMLDNAFASLVTDLEDRGLLGRTLVVMCGEFGRTPKMNDGGNGGAPRSLGTPGRDHWGPAGFCVFAGGGLRPGVVVGSTDRLGTRPKDRPVTPGDLHATIYHVLGIDPSVHFLDRTGRPVPAVDQGRPIAELV